MLFAVALTLANAVQYALSHNVTVAKQLAVVSDTGSAYVKARAQTFPGIYGQAENTMSKSANFSGQFGVIGASQASQFSQNTALLGMSYLYNGGLNHYLSLSSRQQFEQAQADLDRTEQTITSQVSDSYFNVASKNETVRLDRGDLQYQQTLVEVARAKERAGVAAGVDVLSAQAAEEKSRYTLAADQAASQDAAESLAQLIGAPLTIAFNVPAQIAQPAFPAGTVDTLIAIAQQHRADIASAQDAVAIAQTNRRSADTDLYPQISTFAQFGNQFSPTLAVEESAAGPVPRGSPGFWTIGATSTVTLPFVDWGTRRANHRNLNEQIVSAEVNLQSVRGQAELDVRQSYRAAQTALEQLASAQRETSYATEAARIAGLQFAHGLIGFVDVQARLQSALSAQVDLYDARVAYANAIVKLRIAMGIDTPQEAVADL